MSASSFASFPWRGARAPYPHARIRVQTRGARLPGRGVPRQLRHVLHAKVQLFDSPRDGPMVLRLVLVHPAEHVFEMSANSSIGAVTRSFGFHGACVVDGSWHASLDFTRPRYGRVSVSESGSASHPPGPYKPEGASLGDPPAAATASPAATDATGQAAAPLALAPPPPSLSPRRLGPASGSAFARASRAAAAANAPLFGPPRGAPAVAADGGNVSVGAISPRLRHSDAQSGHTIAGTRARVRAGGFGKREGRVGRDGVGLAAGRRLDHHRRAAFAKPTGEDASTGFAYVAREVRHDPSEELRWKRRRRGGGERTRRARGRRNVSRARRRRERRRG